MSVTHFIAVMLVSSLCGCLCSKDDASLKHSAPSTVEKSTAHTELRPKAPQPIPDEIPSGDTPHPEPEVTGPTWYDPTPLFVSLRPKVIAQLPAITGLRNLEDLPFYDLKIDLDIENGTYKLQETLWFTNTGETPLDNIVLRLYGNTAGTKDSDRDLPVQFLGGRCLKPVPCQVVLDGSSAVRVLPAAPIARGGRIRIEMDMVGHLQQIDSSRTNILVQGLEGMATMTTHGGGGDYGLLAQGDGITSLANFYAVLARRQNNNWISRDNSTMGDLGSDEMAHVRATIITDQDVHVVTTGMLTNAPKINADRRLELTVGASLVRDFSILASTEFTSSSRMVDDVTVRSHYLKAEREAGERVLDITEHALRIFEKRFGGYPYQDLDVVEAPLVGGAGGVEFAGLVTVASMLYRPMDVGGGPLAQLVKSRGSTDIMQSRFDTMLEFVTAHEVAHQYWHGLVGSDSRLHPFNDEALAQFSAVLYMEDRYGKAIGEQQANMQVAMSYRMMRMMGQPDGPVDRPVAAFKTPVAYAGLVYGKGPFVYRDLRNAIGDATFFNILRNYIKTYSFRLAPKRAFISMLAEHNSSVRSIESQWLDQQNGDKDLGTADMGQILNMFMGNNPYAGLQSLGIGGDHQPSGEQTSIGMEQLQKELNQLSSGKGAAPTPSDLKELEQLLGMPLPK